MRNLFLLSSFILLFFIFCKTALAQEEFEIKHADKLEADKNQISLKGNLIINYKDATIEAQEGKIETTSEGQPDKAFFFPRAKVKLKDRLLEADKITVLIKDKKMHAEGNTQAVLKDKKNDSIIVMCDHQEVFWSGEGANGKGNLTTTYKETLVTSDQANIIYKNKRPNQAVFSGTQMSANLEQPTNQTSADEIIFDIPTHDIHAFGNVKTLIWPDETKPKNDQDPILVTTEDILVDQTSGTVIAKSGTNKVKVIYQETKGESFEAVLLKNKGSGKPERIIFKGNATVSQPDKQISSEEVIFNFADKKLTSNTKTNIRPKTLIFKK